MGIELARVRLRAIYAGIAGAILLIGVPAVESVTLASSGYLTAVDRTASSGDYRFLLAWIGANSSIDGAFRLLELVPFLLAIAVPSALALALWGVEQSGGRSAVLWLGRLGFACFALADVMGIFTSKSAASAYLTATNAAGQSRAAAQFAQAYAAQNWISHVVGGVLLAVMLGLVCARTLRTSRLPMLTAVLDLLVGALLLVTALEYAAVPARVEAPTSALAFAVLAVWLIAIGIVLWQLRALPVGKRVITEGSVERAEEREREGREASAKDAKAGEESSTAVDAEGREARGEGREAGAPRASDEEDVSTPAGSGE